MQLAEGNLSLRSGRGRFWPALGLAGFLFPLAALPLAAADPVIQVGGTAIAVPVPDGFTPVTPDMARLDRVLETYVAPANLRFISLIPNELVPAVQRGELPNLPRSLSLQTNRKTVTSTVTTSQFNELKAAVRKQNAEMVKQARQQIPALLEDARKKLGSDGPTNSDLKLDEMVPYPPHEDNERSMAYSMRLNVSAKGADGRTVTNPGFVTATFLHLRGKLLFTYVNGGANDLEWTRQTAKTWAAALQTANPSDAATQAKESIPANGFAWDEVLRFAVLGGIIGGVVGLIRKFTGRKRAG